jgi:nitroreductase
MIEQLNWRYAAKKYDATKKISAADLQTLQEAVRLAPTAYGLQPFKVVIVENPAIRAQLKEQAHGQTQVTDASHLFVFMAQNSMENDHVDEYVQRMADTRNMEVANLQGFGDYVKGAVGQMTTEQQAIWHARQAYIGLGVLLTAAASLHIDATPMEGFNPDGFDEVLKIDGYHTVVIAALGYRSEEDAMQHAAKVRKSTTQLFQTI